MKVLVVGSNGRMGKSIIKRLDECGIENLGIDLSNRDDANGFDADVIVDFSLSSALKSNLELACKNKIPIVIATTNHSEENLKEIEKAAREIPIFMAANFSIMFAALMKMLSCLEGLKENDFSLSEVHHKKKIDSPSGSCLQMKKRLETMGITPEVVSSRIGEVVGIHTLSVYSKNERLILSHEVFSREAFLDGVIMATKFIIKKSSGLYGMEDII